MLLPFYQNKFIEAGCDEAGRGCLAGPVFAAAVILPKDFKNETLNDSKKLTREQRNELRIIIEKEAISFAVMSVDHITIDKINILNASYLAMHKSLKKLNTTFEFIIVDGNRFKPFKKIKHQAIVEGDGKYMSIAAASVLAKTYRDDFMIKLHKKFPSYDWLNNKGYGTPRHVEAISQIGYSSHHRKSFIVKGLVTDYIPQDEDMRESVGNNRETVGNNREAVGNNREEEENVR
jgi:ribonuclease HII